jgi:hypothetical protein
MGIDRGGELKDTVAKGCATLVENEMAALLVMQPRSVSLVTHRRK